jgi:hypothetical protein
MQPERTPTAIEICHKAILLLKEGKAAEAQLILEEVVGAEPPPQGVILLRAFEESFRTACRKHHVGAGAFAVFQSVPGPDKVRIMTGGHSRAMATLDEMIRKAILWERAVQVKPGVAGTGTETPAFAVAKGGHA